MEIFNLKNLSFTYNKSAARTLSDITLGINEGEFLLIIGESGCGKTTLLRMLKKELIPYGKLKGSVSFTGESIADLPDRTSSSKIGFIMQNPDAQIVTDKVYSELAFGLENLGFDKETIRSRVSEFATYFGLQNDFERSTDALSGGEKQLLNLASVMAMEPEVIILDEPTAQLDPIASMDFISAVKRLNDDFGITVIIAEHHLEKLLPMADRVAYIEDGRLDCVCSPREICARLRDRRIAETFPAPVRVYNALYDGGDCPLTVREGRAILKKHSFSEIKHSNAGNGETVIDCKNLRFRYEKNSPDVLKGLDLKVFKSEILAVAGGNGCGKSTLLKLINRTQKPYRGRIRLAADCACLPQNPLDFFVRDSLREDFELCGKDFYQLCARFSLEKLLDSHPYDLSGGELQKAAIVKLMLFEPEVILLDEPTKGLDSFSKQELGRFLRELITMGKTIVLVTHDLDFAAEYADRCGLLFDGIITSLSDAKTFFSSNTYYTTSCAAMSRKVADGAVTVNDIVSSIIR